MTRETPPPGGPEDLHGTLVSYAVLTGLTPLIPVPFVDDLAKDFFRRRLVESLAAARRQPLAPGAVEALTAERSGCVLGGCLGQLVIYPLKKLFSKVFFFLEWKRVLDLTSQTYHFGYLVGCALDEGYLSATSPRTVAEVRLAIDAVCREAPIRPVESAVAATFRQSRSALNAAVGEFSRLFRETTGRGKRDRVEATLNAVEAQERRQVAGVAEALQNRLRAVPDAHFQRLREQLRQRLG
jgi:hypothetical protein